VAAEEEVERKQEKEGAQDLIEDGAPAERGGEADIDDPEELRGERCQGRFCQAANDGAQQEKAGSLREKCRKVKGQRIRAEDGREPQPVGVLTKRAHIAVGFGGEEGGAEIARGVNVVAEIEPAEIVLIEPGGESGPI
jgi:hypothetical protein